MEPHNKYFITLDLIDLYILDLISYALGTHNLPEYRSEKIEVLTLLFTVQ